MTGYEQIFKALSDQNRLRLMRLLVVTDQQVCVCELMDAVGLPQYQVSRHLIILKNAGLVSSERKGIWIYYSPSMAGVSFNQRLFDLLKDQVTEKIFSQDEKKLKKRLSLRQGDRCVNGRSGRKCNK
jgi:ArsR family transcriptional regulator, arsenate/arsenite/antimonite-responsive transcriptional repressor